MTSADLPDNPRENPAILDAVDDDARAAELLLGLRNPDKEDLAERRRQWAAEEAKRQRQYAYKVAKKFALNLHSGQSPEIIQAQEGGGVKRSGGGESRYREAMEAIKKRRNSISTTGFELNLMTCREAPTLMDLSLKVLADNSEAIKSLNLVPEHLRKKLSNLVSDKGKFNIRFMQLLIQDSPYEISARNCVDLEEKDLTQILCDCDRVTLKVLNLDLCGRAMTEKVITDFLKRSPNGFPSLTTLSLQGAFCLTDNALTLISRSAPLLQFINLTNCSLLTSRAMKILADYFESTLRGLNIGGCQGISTPYYVFKSSLERFGKLNYLSVAELERINDAVLGFLTINGSNLTDLSIASCNDATEEFMWTVGGYCPKLETLDISGLGNLTETSLQYIADGCTSLNSVKLTKTRFSDDAIAAFLEVSGGSLNQLCLNHVRDVGENTAISLAKVCKRLSYLDLSWCRKLTEEELRRILNCCSSLRSLKLFGWTQVKDEFLEELSRSHVRITGLKMTSVFAHLYDSFPSVDAKFF